MNTEEFASMTDEELDKGLEIAWKAAHGWNRPEVIGMILIAEKSSRDAKRTQRISLWLSILALFVACASCFIAFLGYLRK